MSAIPDRRWTRALHKPARGARLDPEHPRSRGLTGYWLLNEHGGAPVDLVSKQIGSNNGLVWMPEGLAGDGSVRYSSTGVSTVTSSELTVIFRYRTSTSSLGVLGGDADSSFNNFSWFVRNEIASTCQIRTSGGVWGAQIAMPFERTRTGNWVHLAMRYKSGDEARFYLDGVMASDQFETPSGTILAGASPITIGRNGAYNGQHFIGDIGHVGVWSRALSAEELRHEFAEPYAHLTPARARRVFSGGAVGVIHNASVLASSLSLVTPAISTGATVQPSTLALTVAPIAPTVATGATVQPSTPGVSAALISPTVTTGSAPVSVTASASTLLLMFHAVTATATGAGPSSPTRGLIRSLVSGRGDTLKTAGAATRGNTIRS